MDQRQSLKVVIFGDDDFAQVDTAAHRLVSLVARGLELQGCEVSLSCDFPNGQRSLVGRALRSLRRVFSLPPSDVVIYYGQVSTTLLALAAKCWRRRGLVPYLVEWPVAVPGRSPSSEFNARLFCSLVFRIAPGAIVISKYLENMAARYRPSLSVIRVPILCDPAEVSSGADVGIKCDRVRPQITYCADLDGYAEDAFLVVDSVARVARSIDLVLIGRAGPETLARLERRALDAGMIESPRVLSGLSRRELNAEYARSSALLLPLDKSDRSQARFPSKLADYLISGRPVVAAASGEPGTFLSDGETAYLVEGSSASEYAAGICRALDDPGGPQVGERGRALALTELDYRQHGQRLLRYLEGEVRRGPKEKCR